ncbi:RNA polymerase ii transcription factor siii subunit [Phlyctema vagabunda]|uniref:RNA polymerase ii transcription factor siii subunit n=1 Tax=Phlyctema vagabunda TaxID=108571 RepID=A0ABR4P7E1_9HELO
MPAPRLIDSCIKACIRNVRLLTDVGDFEYRTIRPVLKCVSSAKQLHKIEVNSPQIQGEDAELWRAFIARDVPGWRKKNYVPKNPRKWYEVYLRYIKEQQIELERDQEMLRASMQGLKKEKETHVSRVVDLKTLPKMPRDPRMIANNGGVPLKGKGVGFKKQAPSALTWNAGSKTKLTDGKSVLTRARREAKEISQRSKLITPTSQLGGRLGQVKQAPAGMVKEYRTAAQPPVKILSRKRGSNFTGGISGPSLEDREARLRAAMAGNKQDNSGARATYVGSSDDGDEFDDDDDLFSERPPQRSQAGPAPRNASYAPSTRPSQSAPKPSDVISSMISKPKPATSRPSNNISSSASNSRRASPAPAPAPGGKPMMARKRPEVDVFNRAASKRPRLR